MGGTLIKDIRLQPAIGHWFEYRPRKGYNQILAEDITQEMVDEILHLHHAYAIRLGEIFKAKIALAAEIHAVVVSQTTYADFVSENSGRAVAAVLETPYGALTMTCEVELATALMDRVFGGKGVGKKKAAPLTEIESIAMQTVLQPFIEEYQNQWLHAIAGDAQNMALYSPKIKADERLKKDTRVLVYSINVACGDQAPGAIDFMLPFSMFERIYEIYAESKKKLPHKLSIYLSPESVHNVKVPVDVRIGSTQLSIEEVLQLEVGDILQLNEHLTDSLLLSIGDADFWGILGRRRDQYAIKILDRKSKYYSFQSAETLATEHIVREQPVVAAKPAAPVYEPDMSVPTVATQAAAEIIPPEALSGTLTVEDIQIKDSILEEFSAEVKETTTTTNDEFTWDLDDLK